ncbi:MAG: hypothetical protein LBK66_06365 [Spirochaetaceae bacterium]|jgi:hypothetical protein|nr:hypothetical protein [Spirochaetaceae bacterium]
MKKTFTLVLTALFACIAIPLSAQSASSNPFTGPSTGGRWQGRVSYRDSGGVSRGELYELILVPDGTCIITVSGRQDGADVFQDTDGLWSFDETFFRLDCDFPEPVFPHLPAVNWAGVYQFDATGSRFTLLVKPYPNAPNVVRVSFNKVDD